MRKIPSIFAICFQVLLINNAIAQYTIGPKIQVPSQTASASKHILKQQLLSYLLSSTNEVPLSERIEVLAAAVQHMPPRKNRRVYLADVLKQLAFQNLMVAASVCGKATNTLAIPEYVTPLSRAVDYTSLSRQPPSLPNPRNVVVAKAPNEVPLVVNKEQLSLLTRDLLSLLSGDCVSNRAVRYQYV